MIPGDGTLPLALLAPLAVVAGVLSFTSPCTLPLVPGYLSYLSGVSAGRGRTILASVLFVSGFAIVFTALGAAASSLGSLLLAHRRELEQAAGLVIVGLGLFLLGLVRVPLLMRESRPLLERARPGPEGALLLGVAFAIGWSPCIGPVLSAVLVLAGSAGTLRSGALLLLLYSFGLGLPFIAAAVFLDRFARVQRWLRRHTGAINLAGGLLLVGMGLLVFSGQLQRTLAPVLSLYAQLRWPPI